jgi:hypothetical protein
VSDDTDHAARLRRTRSYLRKADPVLARMIDERPDFDPQAWRTELPPMDLYGALLFQVTGQQLSVAATRTTLGRSLATSYLFSAVFEPAAASPVKNASA